MAMSEPIDVEAGGVIGKHLLHQGANDFSIVVDTLPSSVTVDPELTRIDRNRSDNTRAVTP